VWSDERLWTVNEIEDLTAAVLRLVYVLRSTAGADRGESTTTARICVQVFQRIVNDNDNVLTVTSLRLPHGSLNFFTKIKKMVRHYYWLDVVSPLLKQFSVDTT